MWTFPITISIAYARIQLGNLPEYPSEEEKRKREGPREKKKNGIGGVWGKLKESGHRTGRNTSREGTGDCLRGNRAWEEGEKMKGKKGKKAKNEKKKEKKSRENQEPLKLRRTQKYARTRLFVEVEPPSFCAD